MSIFANRHNKSPSMPLSESDNDDDNEQNSSFNQQNEVWLNSSTFKRSLFFDIAEYDA